MHLTACRGKFFTRRLPLPKSAPRLLTLLYLILHIHCHSTLRISHKSHDIDIELHSGVRQGCSLSPALWSIFICYVLHLLSARIPLTHLTAFSDDILSQWQIDEPEAVSSVLGDMGFIIDTLTDLGMSVSDAKTVILDGLRDLPNRGYLSFSFITTSRKALVLGFNAGRVH